MYLKLGVSERKFRSNKHFSLNCNKKISKNSLILIKLFFDIFFCVCFLFYFTVDEFMLLYIKKKNHYLENLNVSIKNLDLLCNIFF